MKITAVTKFKHGELFEALKKLGWRQADLARRTGLRQGEICDIINLRKRPKPDVIEKLQNAFGEAGVFIDVTALWPECFEGFKQPLILTQTRDVDEIQLVGLEEAFQIPQETSVDQELLAEAIDEAMSDLDPREKVVIQDRMAGKTLESIGQKFGVTRDRIRQIEVKAIRNLRHPKRIKKIEAALRGDESITS